MKSRVLVGVLLIVGMALAYQVYHYVEVAQQVSKPVDPSQRFAVSPGAATEDEIQREEKRLEMQLQKDRAEALANTKAQSKAPAPAQSKAPAPAQSNAPAPAQSPAASQAKSFTSSQAKSPAASEANSPTPNQAHK